MLLKELKGLVSAEIINLYVTNKNGELYIYSYELNKNKEYRCSAESEDIELFERYGLYEITDIDQDEISLDIHLDLLKKEVEMNNTIILNLDKNLNYNLLDLEIILNKSLNMVVDTPTSETHLEYDGCDIRIKDNNLYLSTNYLGYNKNGKFLNHCTSDILRLIEDWTKEVFENKHDK